MGAAQSTPRRQDAICGGLLPRTGRDKGKGANAGEALNRGRGGGAGCKVTATRGGGQDRARKTTPESGIATVDKGQKRAAPLIR